PADCARRPGGHPSDDERGADLRSPDHRRTGSRAVSGPREGRHRRSGADAHRDMSTESEKLAAFVTRAAFDDLSASARAQLKIRVLDALGCALGATGGLPVRAVRDQIAEFDGRGACTLVGGGCAAPDRAAFYNSALVRYLDFNDSYLAKGETCHPSD